MTRDETKYIVRILASVYPNFTETTPLIDSWTLVLEDCDFDAMKSATYSYIRTDTKGFAPTPGQLIAQISNFKSYTELTELEAWHLVSKAVRDSAYHAKERFDELPELVRKAVGSPNVLMDWGQTDIQTLGTVIQSNFLRAYRTISERKKEFDKLPLNVQSLIEGTAERITVNE